MEVCGKHGTLDHGVHDGFGNFGFSSSRNRTGLVAENPFRNGTDKMPGVPSGLFLDEDFISGRKHIGVVDQKIDFALFAFAHPADRLLWKVKFSIFWDIND